MSRAPDMHPTVYLFDIDGTLISADGAGRRSLERAFELRHGRADVLDFRFDGMTDPTILEQALTQLNFPSAEIEAETRALIEVYLETLEHEIVASEHYRIHPGVSGVLDVLGTIPGVALGLGTGNVERGAAIKLRRGKLDKHFAFGGFGSDHGNRTELLRVGAERGARRLGKSVSECRIVVIGDTPRDIDAAQRIQAECLAVATGHYSVEELEACAPAVAVASLEDPRVQGWLLGEGG